LLAPIDALAVSSRVVLVEFQATTDDDTGIAYLLYSTISDELLSEAPDRVAAGEDVEMYLGSSAVECREKQSCLDKLAEEFNAAAAIFAEISRSGTDINVSYAWVSCASGRELDAGDLTFEAGSEGRFAQVLLDALGANLAAAERDEDGEDPYAGRSSSGGSGAGDRDDSDDVDWDDDADADDDADDDADEAPGDERYYGPDRDEDIDWGDSAEEREWSPDEVEYSRSDDDDRGRSDEDDYGRSDEDDYGRSDDDDRRSDDDGGSRYSRSSDRDDEDEDDRSSSGRYSARDYLREGDSRSSRSRSDRDDRDDRSSRETDDNRYTRSGPRDRDDEADDDDRSSRTSGRSSRDDTDSSERGRPRDSRRRPKHPEDHEDTSQGVDIDPDLLDTFDDEDDRFDETSRSGTGTMTYQEANERGMGPAEYKRYAASGMTYERWTRQRYNHQGRFHLRFGGFYALGGLDMYYSTRVVMWDADDVLENYWWQSFGFSGLAGGGTLGLGFGVAAPVDLGFEVSLVSGKQFLLREYRTPDKSVDTIQSTEFPPSGGVLHLMLEPKVRVYFTPFKKVKPYAGFGFALLFMPPFKVPEEWAQDRPSTFVLGLEPAVGLQIDSPMGVGFFVEAPFTGYVATDHGVENGLEGEAAYLTDKEKNAPPSGVVPMYLLRVQLGIQIRL